MNRLAGSGTILMLFRLKMYLLGSKFISLRWFSPGLLCLLPGMYLFYPPQLLGAEQDQEQVQPVEFIYPIDAPRDYLSEKFVGFAGSIDRFFGDERNYQESNKSVFQLDITRVVERGGDRKFVLSGKAKLHLPVTEKKLHLLLESDPEKNLSGDQPPGQAVLDEKVVTPGSYGAAVRYEKAEESRWHFSADAGLKFQGVNTNPFVRTRGSYSVAMGQWRLKVAESLFWFNSIGAGESTQLDVEHFLSDPVLFRATSNVTWFDDKQSFDLRQDLSIYHAVSGRTALLYQASAIGVSEPQAQVTEYVVLMLYRYRLHRDWIFFELSPQLHFPRENNYNSVPLLHLRLEMLFDGSK